MVCINSFWIHWGCIGDSMGIQWGFNGDSSFTFGIQCFDSVLLLGFFQSPLGIQVSPLTPFIILRSSSSVFWMGSSWGGVVSVAGTREGRKRSRKQRLLGTALRHGAAARRGARRKGEKWKWGWKVAWRGTLNGRFGFYDSSV